MRPLPKAVGIALAVCVLTGLVVALLPPESRAEHSPSLAMCGIPILRRSSKAKDLDSKELSIEAFKGNAVLLNF